MQAPIEFDGRGELTRRRILGVLRRRGSATLQDIARDVGITRMGVHQHLKLLLAAELVRIEVERGGVGRPRHRYLLSDGAAELFPQGYEAFAAGLLRDIRSAGGMDLLERLFAEQCDRLEREYRPRVDHPTLRERVRRVTEVLEENGYMADWQEVDERTFLIREHNCAIAKISREHHLPCAYELLLLKRLLRADVRRERHIASGDPACVYVVREGGAH